ncbi:putative protein SRC2 [Cocos nucifera]|uniref:Uncharacterized protein n=1 Tax=Cocos nucifera TaxID=13894 RepID=A0A8K0IN67_COCNU|nr:putative protein SRC2 [Cocos nucifera]
MNATLVFADPATIDGLALCVLLRSECVLDDRDVSEVYISFKELLDGVTSTGNSFGHFVSHQVCKLSSGKPKGILNLSYKFVEALSAATLAAPPVTLYSFPTNETKAGIPSTTYLVMPSYLLPAEYVSYPLAGPYSPPAAAAVGSKHRNPARATTAHPSLEKDGKESKVGEPVTVYPAAAQRTCC